VNDAAQIYGMFDLAYSRKVMFAVELLDPVTLERVSQGVKVVAQGLKGMPILNASGQFIWLKEDIGPLIGISIDPISLPYQRETVSVDELKLPSDKPLIMSIELLPRTDYAPAAGTTGLRGSVFEDRMMPAVAVRDADVRMQWLDEDNVTWMDAPGRSRTNTAGDFVAVLRLAPTDTPHVDPVAGLLTVRLFVKRSDGREWHTASVKIRQSYVEDASTVRELIFAWDEMQP